MTSVCAVCQNGPLAAPESGCMKYSCKSKSKINGYCIKMADASYSSWELYNALIESSSGWSTVQADCSDKDYEKTRNSGSKGLTAAASLPDLQRDQVRFSQCCYWISL